jgi:hypothetical protein
MSPEFNDRPPLGAKSSDFRRPYSKSYLEAVELFALFFSLLNFFELV